MSLNETGALYDATRALDPQDVPIMAKYDPDAIVWQKQALKTQTTHPQLKPHPHQDGTRGFPCPTKLKSKYTSTTTWGWKAA